MQKVIFFTTERSQKPGFPKDCGGILKVGKSKFLFCLLALAVCGVSLVVWDLRAFPKYLSTKSEIPFSHEKHGENLGMDCAKCHPGAYFGIRATMPSRADCMDCHNLPLSESPEIEKLERVLPNASERPFEFESRMPANVFFPHGLHAKAKVSCEICHGSPSEIDAGRRPEVRMQECLACHRGEREFPKASTDCARCHR